MSINILIVDDEERITQLLSRHLLMQGFDVYTSNEPGKALEFVKHQHFHVVITDIDMPGMSGIDLLKEIKNLNGMIHVIMITGQISMSNVLDCMRRGADTCIFKPFSDLEIITSAVQRAIDDIEHWHEILKTLQSTDFSADETAAARAA